MAPRPAAKAAAPQPRQNAPQPAAAPRPAAPVREPATTVQANVRPNPQRTPQPGALASLRAVTPTQPPADPRNDQFAERLRVQREAPNGWPSSACSKPAPSA